MKQPIVEVNHLYKSYRFGKYAVEDVSFTIPAGHIVGLLGPNGCGKTTTLKLLNSVLQPSKGEILINGQKPDASTHALISYMPDQNFLDLSMTVEEAMLFYHDLFADFRIDQTRKMLHDMNIQPDSRLKELSKGMLEKVQLALVMGRQARLYILDEPIGGVDPAARETILREILLNYHEDAAILISTHLISEVENFLDDVIVMKEGRVLLQESTEVLREQKGESVNSYFKKLFSEM